MNRLEKNQCESAVISNGRISNKGDELCQKLHKMFLIFTINPSTNIVICKDIIF